MFMCHILISFGFIFKLIDMTDEEYAKMLQQKLNLVVSLIFFFFFFFFFFFYEFVLRLNVPVNKFSATTSWVKPVM